MIFIIYFHDANYDSINKQQGVIAEIFCRVGCGGDIKEARVLYFRFFFHAFQAFFQKMFFLFQPHQNQTATL